MSTISKRLEYEYKNCPIPGGGYVTGFLYHPTVEGILYARTDIGGVYRFDYDNKSWKSLTEYVTNEKIDETFPIALAVSRTDENLLYVAAGHGEKENGVLCISEDKGENFIQKSLPFPVHGNWGGRGTGLRLLVSEACPGRLYFASQKSGLYKSSDNGDSWVRLPIEEDYMTFIFEGPDGNTLVAGAAGYSTRVNDRARSHGIYVSYDGGESFTELMCPESPLLKNAKMNGLVAQRYSYDGKYLYVTFAATGEWNYIVDLGYSCETGGVVGGKVVRYEFENGRISGFTDITPCLEDEGIFVAKEQLEKPFKERVYRFGFGGISACSACPGLLALSTMSKDSCGDDIVFRSIDYGNTWERVLEGLEIGKINFNSTYMLPKYNGGRSLIHWLSATTLNPFDKNECLFNTGTGIFRSCNFTAKTVEFHDECRGIEETVHLNLYAPYGGDVKLVDILGDLGGFAFTDLDTPCDTSFSDREGNRYITCINADLSDLDYNLGIVSARGNWRGLTKGGLIVTKNNFKDFDRLAMPFGLSKELDEHLHFIECPNVNPGWVAMSPDGENIVWSVADGISLPVSLVIASTDSGKSFCRAEVRNIKGDRVNEGLFKAFSDSVNPKMFYGFSDTGAFYVSRDGGRTFEEKAAEGGPDKVNFGLIDTINKTEIRRCGGESGVFYFSASDKGLWKYVYDFEKDCIRLTRLSGEGDRVYRMGLGLGREGGDYFKNPKAIYMCANICGEFGFYRTLDEGKTFEKLNNKKQNFGDINSVEGDKREFGRFFIATGTLGVKYGISRKQ